MGSVDSNSASGAYMEKTIEWLYKGYYKYSSSKFVLKNKAKEIFKNKTYRNYKNFEFLAKYRTE